MKPAACPPHSNNPILLPPLLLAMALCFGAGAAPAIPRCPSQAPPLQLNVVAAPIGCTTAPCGLADACPCASLRLALAVAANLTAGMIQPSVQLVVAAGTYSGHDNTELILENSGCVSILGNPRSPTVLDAENSATILLASGRTVLELSHLVLQGGSNGDVGGALLVGENASAIVTDVRFVDNTGVHGGAASVIGGAAAFINCVFQHNVATVSPSGASGIGGGLLGECAQLYVENCLFYLNTAFGSPQTNIGGIGGALYLIAPVMSGCPAYSPMEAVVRNTAFQENLAAPLSSPVCGGCYGTAGAVFVHGGSALFENCTFQQNVAFPGNGPSAAGGAGGALVIESDIPTTARVASTNGHVLRNCSFLNNVAMAGSSPSASGQGGAVVIVNTNATFETSVFRSNLAEAVSVSGGSGGGSGGAISMSGTSNTQRAVAWFTTCRFEDNTARASEGFSYGQGGAIFMQGYELVLENVVMIRNTAQGAATGGLGGKGGAVCGVSLGDDPSDTVSNVITIVGGTFADNFAAGSTDNPAGFAEGGAIELLGKFAVSFVAAHFSNNTAQGSQTSSGEGGAVALTAAAGFNSTAELRNCVFRENTATGSGQGCGGGMCLQDVTAVLDGCNFVGNSMLSGTGGGVGSKSELGLGSLHLRNCSFVGNTAIGGTAAGGGGGGLASDLTPVVMQDVVFVDNRAVAPSGGSGSTIGAGLYVANANASVGGQHCTFVNNVLSGAQADSNQATGNHAFVSAAAAEAGQAASQVYFYFKGQGSGSGSQANQTLAAACTFEMACSLRSVCYLCLGNSSCGWLASAAEKNMLSCDLQTATDSYEQDLQVCCPGRCSGHGSCNSVDNLCSCHWAYRGESCSALSYSLLALVIGLAVALLVSIVVVTVVVVGRRRRSLFQVELRELLLKTAEDEMEQRMPKSVLIEPGEIVLGELLGVGGSGSVFRGRFRHTDVAVKKLTESLLCADLNLDNAETVRELTAEARCQLDLRHPNLCMLIGCCLDKRDPFIVMEFCPRGSLWGALHSDVEISASRKLSIAKGAALALAYLHDCKPPLVHRDFKSPNILLDEHWTPKVTDFGLTRRMAGVDVERLARRQPAEGSTSSSRSSLMDRIAEQMRRDSVGGREAVDGEVGEAPTSSGSTRSGLQFSVRSTRAVRGSLAGSSEHSGHAASAGSRSSLAPVSEEEGGGGGEPGNARYGLTANVGTVQWCAPEMFSPRPGKVEYDQAVDVWAYGIVLWELETRQAPFAQYTFPTQVMDAVLSGERPEIPAGCAMGMRLLIRSCWSAIPSERPLMTEIVEMLRGQ